jgi:hypothetical protein
MMLTAVGSVFTTSITRGGSMNGNILYDIKTRTLDGQFAISYFTSRTEGFKKLHTNPQLEVESWGPNIKERC